MIYRFLISIILFHLITLLSFGQSVTDTMVIECSNKVTIPQDFSIELSDTLNIKQIPFENEKKSFVSRNISWITAIIIAFISVIGNLWVARRQAQRNSINLKAQIENNEKILDKQIQNSKEIAITEFKATIAANNRQGWINELRETVSDFLTNSLSLAPDDIFSKEEELKYYNKLFYTKFKIELLLNTKTEEHKLLLQAINKVIEVIRSKEDYNLEKLQTARDVCLEASRRIIKIEWEKIKALK
ncbi:hypothetical protein [Plebeiibacterium sediminum]|uniref:Uncharacterized protein n=1 Tax=Plebeiibacterium sediminum TaxID=2992112 RepID=A0AAE3M9W5_9BACT|nr:hypothetical protein [Plebeiobacterium sediminum]MCW3789627.1 hypothetical protein [Plebeiobacterium sediminum]